MRGFLLLSLGVLSFSAPAADLPGGHDLDVLPCFPRAEIVNFCQVPSEECAYPLRAIGRISGRLRMEGKVRAEGKLTVLTYRLPPEHSSQEVLVAARTALLKADTTPLLWCERRDCGSSSLLANVVFGNARLYGPDEQQVYLLVRLTAPQENSLVTVYLITRGNRRTYLQAEELKIDAPLAELLPSPAILLRPFKTNDELTLSYVPAELAGSWLELLVRTLRPDTGVWVELSGKRAQEWYDALRGQSVLNNRMELGQLEVEGLHLNWLHRTRSPGSAGLGDGENAFGKVVRQSRLPSPYAPCSGWKRRTPSVVYRCIPL